MKTQIKLLTICHLLNAICLSAYAQGSLTPPGAPGPTMKTLDQVEARTPIDVAHTPGDGTNQFIISMPGSYYLTGNLIGVGGLNGISVQSDNVTIDLNGFALMGGSNTLNGINVPGLQKNLRVHNGSVQNWGQSGVNCGSASNSQFDHLRASQNRGMGILSGDGSVLNACCVETNGSFGMFAGAGNTLTGCTALNNSSVGIGSGSYCTVTACSVTGNGAGGFAMGNNCSIIGCSSSRNNGHGFAMGDGCTVKDCTSTFNAFTGINGGALLTISSCTACYNSGDGIVCFRDCLISGNIASYNANGIRVSAPGSLNRIDGNTANHNSNVGILWQNDLVVRNSAFLNGSANYSPGVGTGNTGPLNAASSSTSPWANF